MSQTALLEIGVEEIPASVVLPALEQMQALAAAGLERSRLEFGEVCTYGTPRRLTLMVNEVADKQPDVTREVKGPPADKAFDAGGSPTQAGEGFARSRGVAVGDLEVRETEKGRFVFAQVTEAGRPAAEVLAELWPELIGQLTFPKTMRWADLGMRFARPIRWLVALYGPEEVRFEVAGVQSGRTSRGHRFLHPGPVELPSAADYLPKLDAAFVIADIDQRKTLIRQRVEAAAEEAGGRARLPEGSPLLEEVSFLVEYPTCVCGSFPERHLSLPEPVLVTVMAKHQRYFPVEDAHGKLMPRFVAVRNGGDRSLETVRIGNETVIVARFDDAEFYYTEDQKRPLSAHLPDLERVTFMERQGSLREKTERIVKLARDLCEELGLEASAAEAAGKAAELCKCDLVSLMVQDLTSLQGTMGAEYARLEGFPPAVCQAIAEHYQPRFAGDELPASDGGKTVSLADKIDNLVACFALDLIPKGTSDPHALRRQAAGVLSILLGARWRVDLPALLAKALGRLPQRDLSNDQALNALREFFALRLDAVLEDAGVAYDIRRAVLAAPCPDLLDAHDRAIALQAAREGDGEAFEKTTYAAARVRKIIRPAEEQVAPSVAPDLFERDIEGALLSATEDARQTAEPLLREPGERDYGGVWDALCRLERPIWDYFDVDTGVMVMADDPAVRANRLATLREADRLFLKLADFSEIVVE
jgi:glycyl-tRNA synthetase beta chain